MCLVASGCATKKESGTQTETTPSKKTSQNKASQKAEAVKTPSMTVTNGNAIMTISDTQYGKVFSVNASLHFAVLDYSLNQVPNIGDRLFIYRQGIKVAEVRVSGPQMNSNIVADIVAGEVKVGDEVRRN
jgi:hypothetical protein